MQVLCRECGEYVEDGGIGVNGGIIYAQDYEESVEYSLCWQCRMYTPPAEVSEIYIGGLEESNWIYNWEKKREGV